MMTLKGLEMYTLSKISAHRASQRKQMLTQFGGHLYWWVPSDSSYHLSESEAFMKSDKVKKKKNRIIVSDFSCHWQVVKVTIYESESTWLKATVRSQDKAHEWSNVGISCKVICRISLCMWILKIIITNNSQKKRCKWIIDRKIIYNFTNNFRDAV